MQSTLSLQKHSTTCCWCSCNQLAINASTSRYAPNTDTLDIINIHCTCLCNQHSNIRVCRQSVVQIIQYKCIQLCDQCTITWAINKQLGVVHPMLIQSYSNNRFANLYGINANVVSCAIYAKLSVIPATHIHILVQSSQNLCNQQACNHFVQLSPYHT